jgi:hypothetical protein
LEQHDRVNGVAWRQEGLELRSRLLEGLAASEKWLDSGSADPQTELAFQQSLYTHLARIDRLMDVSDSQRALHQVVAAHGARPDLSLGDQLSRLAPESTPQAFSRWLDGQLVNARISLASIQSDTTNQALASSEDAKQRGQREAMALEVSRLQQARDDALTLWGIGAADAVAFVSLQSLQEDAGQVLLGGLDERPSAMLDTTSLQPLQEKIRLQVDGQLQHRLAFGEGPTNGLNDAEFASAIGLQADIDYLASTSDEMIMLQIWAQRAALGWESSDVGQAAGVMADALQASVRDLRERAEALQSMASSAESGAIVRMERSPNGRLEEVLEDQASEGSTSGWMAFASQAAAQALVQRANTLETVATALRNTTASMV